MASLNWPVPYPGPMDVTAPVPAGTIFPSAARGVGVYNSPELSNYAAKGVRLYINTTVTAGGATLVVKVQTKDPTTGVWADIDSGAGGPTTATINSNTMTLLTLYPGQAETANQEVSDILGLQW